MQLMIFIIVMQFVVILWLAWPRIKPKAVDAYAKAKEITQEHERSQHDQWVYDFNAALGIVPKQETPQSIAALATTPHALKDVRTSTSYGSEILKWTCNCGHSADAYSVYGMNSSFEEHVKMRREAAKFGH